MHDLSYKKPPSDEESERVLLGFILLDNRQMEFAATLDEADFYAAKYRELFRAMLSLHRQQRPIDPVLLGVEMGLLGGNTEAFGGVSGITNLTFGLPLGSPVEEYVQIIRQKATLRRLVSECGRIITDAMNGEDRPAEILASAQNRINDLCLAAQTGHNVTYFPSLADVIDDEVMQRLVDIRDGKVFLVTTGFPRLDRLIGGLELSEVLLIGADTGGGKSALALQLSYNIAKSGNPVAFVAGEMTSKSNVLRLLTQVSHLANLNAKLHMSQHDFEFAMQWAEAIRDLPIYFEHRIFDIATLRTHLHSLVRRQGVKVCVIDYIQLFKLDRVEKRQRVDRIADASQEVKQLASELGIVIIEVAQLNRVGAKAIGGATIHDFEGSGQLEKDASMIFLLETDEYDPHKDYLGARIRVEKGRNTGKGSVEGKFFMRNVRFDFD